MGALKYGKGWTAISKLGNKHNKFRDILRGTEFTIIRIEPCSGDAGGCSGCPGNPVIIFKNEELPLCGWSVPWENFTFREPEWDD